MKYFAQFVLPLVLSVTAWSQTQIDTTVGGNQTYNAYGVQTEFKWHNIKGWTGLGYNDGFKLGAYAQVPVMRSYHIGVGDQMLPGFLDVDEYDTHAFTARGASLASETSTSRIQIFAGLLTQEQAYPFFHMGNTSGTNFSKTPMGGILAWKKFSESLQVHSMFLVQDKITSIQSLGWRPSKKWGLAGAAGIGSGAGYFAGKGEFRLNKASGWASYTLSGKEFHRQDNPFYSTEPVGFNTQLMYAPWSRLRMNFDHEKTRVFIPSFPSVLGTFNNVQADADILKFQLSSGYSYSTTSNLPGHTTTEVYSVQRQLLPRWRSFASYVHMVSPSYKQNMYLATNEYKVNARLAIRQNYTWTNGQNSFTFGGTWISNRLSFSIDQRTYMSELAPAFGGKPIFQAWTFSIRFRSPKGTSTQLSTVVNPQGKVEWGGYMGGLRYNALGPTVNSGPVFTKYIIQGKVEDETGKGVWGIAVMVGPETVISDNDGVFFIHVKNAKPMPMAVAADASLQPSRWTLESAPTVAIGSLETAPGEPIKVVIQMANHTQDVARAGGQ